MFLVNLPIRVPLKSCSLPSNIRVRPARRACAATVLYCHLSAKSYVQERFAGLRPSPTCQINVELAPLLQGPLPYLTHSVTRLLHPKMLTCRLNTSRGWPGAKPPSVSQVLVCSSSLHQYPLPTAMYSPCRPTRASVLSSHIEGANCRLHYTLRPMTMSQFALPCRISPPHRADRVSQDLPTIHP
jgi:hypothetical protein